MHAHVEMLEFKIGRVVFQADHRPRWRPCVTSAAGAGVDALEISNQTRHKSLDTVKRYARPSTIWKSNAAFRVGMLSRKPCSIRELRSSQETRDPSGAAFTPRLGAKTSVGFAHHRGAAGGRRPGSYAGGYRRPYRPLGNPPTRRMWAFRADRPEIGAFAGARTCLSPIAPT
jgi:hypothetical protein